MDFSSKLCLVQTYPLPPPSPIGVGCRLLIWPNLICTVITDSKTARIIAIGALGREVRTRQGWVQRHLLYLGEINDSQKAAWTKVTEVFDPVGQQTRGLALYPADREVPVHAADYGVQVRLDQFELRRPRQWGACWAGCHLWDQLKLDEFWRDRLPDSREGTCWRHVLETLTVYRLIDPGSEWRLHRQWFENSAMADLLEEDFSLAEKNALYRCLDKVLEHRPALFHICGGAGRICSG